MPVNLLDLDGSRLAVFMGELGEKPYRARQLLRWVHRFGAADFAVMTDMPKTLREKLATAAEVRAPRVLEDCVAADGTRKWLLDVGTGNAVDSVFIPEVERAARSDRGDAAAARDADEPAPDGARYRRATLCISSQAGCALECSFCSTDRQGFNRNLTTAEIIGQLWWANHCLAGERAGPDKRVISNVVMMGMGEPLANFDNVVAALKLMLDDNAYGLSRRRVTLSTSGLVPQIDRLRDACPVALAVSLHAPSDALRNELVPINRKWPLRQLLAACVRYIERAPRDFVTFEYCMLDGVNDRVEQARDLVKLTRDVPCKFNLIPFNAFANSGYRRSDAQAIARFRDVLMQAGLVVTVRRTRGDDIDAACGQLAGQVRDRTQRSRRNTHEAVA